MERFGDGTFVEDSRITYGNGGAVTFETIGRGWVTPSPLPKLPLSLCWLITKGKDCEAAGSQHRWYNLDGESSGCYHCKVIRPGQLWRSRHEC